MIPMDMPKRPMMTMPVAKSPLEEALGMKAKMDEIRKKYGMPEKKKEMPSQQWMGDNQS